MVYSIFYNELYLRYIFIQFSIKRFIYNIILIQILSNRKKRYTIFSSNRAIRQMCGSVVCLTDTIRMCHISFHPITAVWVRGDA